MQDKFWSLIGVLVVMFIGALVFSWVLTFAGIVSLLLGILAGAAALFLYRFIDTDHEAKDSLFPSFILAAGIFLACVSIIPMLPISDYCRHQYAETHTYNAHTNQTYIGFGSIENLCENNGHFIYEIENKPISLAIRLGLFLGAVVLILSSLRDTFSSAEKFHSRRNNINRLKAQKKWANREPHRCLAGTSRIQGRGLTVKGSYRRCKNKRTAGRYCKLHAEKFDEVD
ncbi:SoxR reducing system RseC family protein [Parasphingorhabdus sp.]|uniref:SoxR reducing system RseC family protein n=1 Tax=Parasphingorhabdus sp. TaxID=2709688 RepID=UPI003002004B